MVSRRRPVVAQAGAIVFRRKGDVIELLLITSRTRKRWIVPKGHVEGFADAAACAAAEAWEEAGVTGRILEPGPGSFEYRKRGRVARVELFLLADAEVHDAWPEMDERRRRWMTPEAAADAVEEAELKAILLKVPDLVKEQVAE